MSRINAASRVISQYHWTKARFAARRKPIYAHQSEQIIGYFDRILVKGGRMKIEGWVDAPKIHISTELESTVVTPDLQRADAPTVNSTPGFSVSLRGSQLLFYGFFTVSEKKPVPIQNPVSNLVNAVRTAVSLVPFPLQYGKDLVSYFLRGNIHAGDRLERALIPLGKDEVIPIAASGLFGRRPLPAILSPVDIIVPVFNADTDVRRCLSRLVRNTDPMHRILVIDDASTSPMVKSFLQGWVDATPNARLLENESNIGFVETINRGLEAARGHVVLLNTDAFVPAGWLERLMAPILVDDYVASVTPMSNDAEIFSAPVECRRSSLTDGRAEKIDRIAQRLDWQASLCTAPTGVGFCMAMNRSWLEREPRFDTAFGHGYGEEVDWCRKVAQKGAVHIGIGCLFVEHRGAGSFGTGKLERLRKSNAIIETRYPGYDQMVTRFRRTDPVIGPRLALALSSIDVGAPVPVYLAHRMGGGAEYWLSEKIEEHLENRQGVAVIREDDQPGRVVVEIHSIDGVTRGLIDRHDLSGFLAIPQRVLVIYSCLVGGGDPFRMLRICAQRLTESDHLVFVFHDFFPLCPSYNLIGRDGKYCGLPERRICATCYAGVAGSNGLWRQSIDDWRNEWRAFIDRADSIITFSEDSRRHVLKVWPELMTKTLVRPHVPRHPPRPVTSPDGEKVIVGVLGGIGYPKGAGVLKRLANCVDDRFELVVIGEIDATFYDPRITVHGSYTRREIDKLAETYGVTCWFIPSIWPETFSFAVRECLATGLQVFGFDLGAQGEALREHENGRTIPLETDVDDLRKILSGEGRSENS
ncbi:MAG: glycosyltransferase [Paracoccaceae bacterium]